MSEDVRVRTRAAVAFVVSIVLLSASPFAYLAWAVGGLTELVAFAAALAVLVGLITAITVLVRRPDKG